MNDQDGEQQAHGGDDQPPGDVPGIRSGHGRFAWLVVWLHMVFPAACRFAHASDIRRGFGNLPRRESSDLLTITGAGRLITSCLRFATRQGGYYETLSPWGNFSHPSRYCPGRRRHVANQPAAPRIAEK